MTSVYGLQTFPVPRPIWLTGDNLWVNCPLWVG